MSQGGAQYPGPLHLQRTSRSGHEYFFYDKHHRGGIGEEAQWLTEPDLTRDEEFGVFNRADLHILSDEKGNLFGLRERNTGGRVPELGTRGEQFAKFPLAEEGQAWHGFPNWPIARDVESHESRPIPRETLRRMVEVNLLTSSERRRVQKGKHI